MHQNEAPARQLCQLVPVATWLRSMWTPTGFLRNFTGSSQSKVRSSPLSTHGREGPLVPEWDASGIAFAHAATLQGGGTPAPCMEQLPCRPHPSEKKHWRIGPIRNMIGPSGTNCTFNWLNGVLDGSNWASKDFFRLSTAAFDTSDQYRQDTGTSKAPPLSRSL